MNFKSDVDNPLPTKNNDKNFKFLTASSLFSLFGDQIILLTLPWLVISMTSDPLILGSVLGTFGLPLTILMLLGGVLADRFSPQKILLVSKLMSALILGVIAFLLFKDLLVLQLLYFLVFLLGTCTAFAAPAVNSLVPKVVEQQKLQSANGILMSLRSLSTLVGPLIAGFILSTGGDGDSVKSGSLALTFAISSATFILSTFFVNLMLVNIKTSKSNQSVIKDLTAAFSYTWKQKQLRLVICYAALTGLFISGPIQVGLPLFVKEQLDGGPGALGLLVSASALGGMIGMLLAAKIPQIGKLALGLTLLMFDFIIGFVLIGFSLIENFIVAFSILLVLQILPGYIQVALITWIQGKASPEMLGRLMSIVMFTVVGLLPLSAGLAGILLSYISPAQLFVFSGISLSLVSFLAFLFTEISNIQKIRKPKS